MSYLIPNHQPRAKFCLTMIVRDEAHCITRCLASCRLMLDFVRIIDTGSTDGTPEVIRKWCKKNRINCQVICRPWVDFAHNRNEALEFAHECPATHLILIDADEVMHLSPTDIEALRIGLPANPQVLFSIPMVYERSICPRTNLVRNVKGRLKYHFPMHEELWLDGDSTPTLTLVCNPRDYKQGPHVTTPQDGARSKSADRLAKDAAVLAEAWQKDQNPRHLFYLAQVLRIGAHQSQDPEIWQMVKETYDGYLKDAPAGHPHRYVAALWSARILEWSGTCKEIIAAYLKAYEIDPLRPEALGSLASYCFDSGEHCLAREFASKVKDCQGSTNHAFLEIQWQDRANQILNATMKESV